MPQLGTPGNEAARAKVKTPAMILMILSIIGIVLAVLMIGLNIFGVAVTGAEGGQQTVAVLAQGIGGVISNIFTIAFNAFMIFGYKKMMALESRAIVIISLILALNPCCSPCCILSMPIGIWGLVVMFDPVVKTSFKS